MARGQKIAYKRVSTADQNTARQLEGIEVDKTFEDKVSGKNLDRPAFEAMLNHVREGDTVFVHSMDRLARNLSDLLATVERFNSKGVGIRFIKENLSFEPGNEASPMATLTLQLLGAFAQFERALILERQREGIAVAKAKGAYTGGNNKLAPDIAEKIRERVKAGATVAEVAREFGVSRQTVYGYTEGVVQREAFRGGSNKKDPETVQRIKQRLSEGASPTAVAKELGVSRQTVYTYAGGSNA